MVNTQHLKSSQSFRLLLSSLVLGLPTIAIAEMITAPEATAQLRNPCPQLYYEEPFNSDRAVPAGCPPNAATQRLIDERRAPASPVVIPPSDNNVVPPAAPDSATPPLPETVQNVIATVTPVSGAVDVVLRNETNTPITYQALESTDQRTLAAGTEVVLQNLPAPTTINLIRPDGGFIRVTSVPNQEPGRLALALNATGLLGENVRSLQIQADGQVLAY